MRFATKFDPWLVVLLVLAAVVSCIVLPIRLLFGTGTHPPPLLVAFLPWVLWPLVLASTLPQYYEVREDGLFLRQGWRKVLIPYASLSELRSITDGRSAGVFSMSRMLVGTITGKRYVIAVAEEGRFRAEVSKRCPRLNPASGSPSFALME